MRTRRTRRWTSRAVERIHTVTVLQWEEEWSGERSNEIVHVSIMMSPESSRVAGEPFDPFSSFPLHSNWFNWIVITKESLHHKRFFGERRERLFQDNLLKNVSNQVNDSCHHHQTFFPLFHFISFYGMSVVRIESPLVKPLVFGFRKMVSLFYLLFFWWWSSSTKNGRLERFEV